MPDAMRRIAHTLALFPSFNSFDDAAGVLAPIAYYYWRAVLTARLLLPCSLPRVFFSLLTADRVIFLGGIKVVLNTWQYFFHRAMHLNQYLYKHLHLVHQRLYFPYAFGAIYNHPFERFLLDTLGALLSESLAGLSIRQATLFFIITTCKGADDHCGYNLQFDPFQMLSGNMEDYQDIHRQTIGIN